MMKSFSIKLCLVACLLLQAGCDLTLKRKSSIQDPGPGVNQEKVDMEKSVDTPPSAKNKKPAQAARAFSERDIKLIDLYYSNTGNAQVLDDMIKQTWVSSKIENKLTVNETIPADVQVMPLPLELEKILSPLTRYALRVQVGKRVMIMDIKSRQILDVIKLK